MVGVIAAVALVVMAYLLILRSRRRRPIAVDKTQTPVYQNTMDMQDNPIHHSRLSSMNEPFYSRIIHDEPSNLYQATDEDEVNAYATVAQSSDDYSHLTTSSVPVSTEYARLASKTDV